MERCWDLNPQDRPSFGELSRELAAILENATDNYGYVIATSNYQQSDTADE